MSGRITGWRMEQRPVVRDGVTLADGYIVYELDVPGIGGLYEMVQYYRRGPNPGRVGRVGNVWGWDGSVDRPTLTPSYLATTGGHVEMGIPALRVHLYMRHGQIDLLSDSNVTLDLGEA